VSIDWKSPPSAGWSRLAALVIGLVVVLAACAYLWVILVPVLGIPLNQVEATIAPTGIVSGRNLVVTGTTTFPDGTIFDYSVGHDTRADLHREGVTTVADGRLAFEEDLESWPAGTLRLSVAFDPTTDQPASVLGYSGRWGERLIGPQVHSDSGDKWVETESKVEFPAEAITH
jgi:hypothetical protein